MDSALFISEINRKAMDFRKLRRSIIKKTHENKIIQQTECMIEYLKSLLDGYTIIDIASEIEVSGIHYHADSAAWNKNMVKRILSNNRYIGNEDFPQIISPEDFTAVRVLDVEKQSHRIPSDESIKSSSGASTPNT